MGRGDGEDERVKGTERETYLEAGDSRSRPKLDHPGSNS